MVGGVQTGARFQALRTGLHKKCSIQVPGQRVAKQGAKVQQFLFAFSTGFDADTGHGEPGFNQISKPPGVGFFRIPVFVGGSLVFYPGFKAFSLATGFENSPDLF